MPGERSGRFGGNLIRTPALGGVPAAIPNDDDPNLPTQVPTDPAPESEVQSEFEEQRPRTSRKPPTNVRIRPRTGVRFQEAYLDEKTLDLDLSITNYASDLLEEALAARAQRRQQS